MGKLRSLVAGIDFGGTNTDAALVFTPHAEASAAVVAQLEVWATPDQLEASVDRIVSASPPCIVATV